MIISAVEFVALRTSEDPADQDRASRDDADVSVWLDVVANHPSMRQGLPTTRLSRTRPPKACIRPRPRAAATTTTIVWAGPSHSSLHALDLTLGSTSVVPLPPGPGEVTAVVPHEGGQRVAVVRGTGSDYEFFVVTLDGARVDRISGGAAPANAVRVHWADAETLVLTRPTGNDTAADVSRAATPPGLLVSWTYAGPVEPALVGPLFR